MAADTTGNKSLDSIRTNQLCLEALEFSLKILKPNCKIIELDHITEGAACTTLLAKEFINTNDPLIIANSDQYIKWDSIKSMYNYNQKKIDGSILTFEAIHPKWSYAKTDNNNFVTEVAEKKVISKNNLRDKI